MALMKVIKLEKKGFQIIATMEDGRNVAWSDCKTERGARMMFYKHAKTLGFKSFGFVATPEQN